MNCSSCGRILPDNATFCTSCGWKTDNWTKEAKRSRSIHLSAVASVVIGVLALVFLCIVFLLNN